MRENVPLASLTTLGVGGPARRLVAVGHESFLRETLRRAAAEEVPLFLLGGGSNIVFADSGWPGLVIQPALLGRRVEGSTITVGAGENWDLFVERMARAGWAGIECLAGIPGTVGATPIQNVGAYGQEVSQTIVAVRAMDRTTLEIHEFSHIACGFDYRASRFNTSEIGRWIVLSVTFALRPGGAPTLRYADLARHFGDGVTPSLVDVTRAVRAIRASKGMVIDPTDPDSRSAGSFFKNPIVAAARAPKEAPVWPQSEDQVKIPAAWLIERAGFARGQALVGGVRLSSKHVLALVNRGDATASDVASSAQHVQRGVFETWGIRIAPEPLFVGAWLPDQLPDGAMLLAPA